MKPVLSPYFSRMSLDPVFVHSFSSLGAPGLEDFNLGWLAATHCDGTSTPRRQGDCDQPRENRSTQLNSLLNHPTTDLLPYCDANTLSSAGTRVSMVLDPAWLVGGNWIVRPVTATFLYRIFGEIQLSHGGYGHSCSVEVSLPSGRRRQPAVNPGKDLV